jgi:hypothetical protein
VGRKSLFKIGEDINVRDFDIGQTVLEGRTSGENPYKNYYRHFKADLALVKTALASPDGTTWEMKTLATDRDRKHGGRGEMINQDGKTKEFFNPKTAAYVFLRKLCAQAIKRAKDITGAEESIKVHVTAPAYEGTDKNRSQRYRDHVREAIDKFKGDRLFSGVEFVVGQDDFLYEPYGVYYYYAFIQQSVSLGDEEAGKTYLIYDMGGSTTDVGIVQINRKGKVTTAYPICKSIDCAGAYFDRFILKYLRGEDRLRTVSAKWNPEFEKIEEAKIALCTGKKDRVKLEIKGETYTLTRKKIADALKELWSDDNRDLAQGFRGFLDDVRQHAKENPLFLGFDRIEKVFLAGGSTGLPGIKELILDTLKSSRFDLVSEEATTEDTFEEPALASSSSVAALGRAAELANAEGEFVLSRADQLFAKIADESGNSFVFRSPLKRGRGIEKKEDETFLFSIQELQSRLNGDESWVEFEEGDYQNYNPQPEQDFPEQIEISFRTNISDYPSAPHLSENVVAELKDKISSNRKIWFSASCQARYDQESVQIKPFIFLNSIGFDERKRLYRGQGSHRISLKPGQVDGDVHVCIDLGMNNTAVAIATPGRSLPSDVEDLDIPQIDTESADNETPTAGGEPSGDGAMPSSKEAPVIEKEATGSSSVTISPTIDLSDDVLDKLQGIIERALDSDKASTQQLDTDALATALSSSLDGVKKQLDAVVNALVKMREQSEESGRSPHPAEEILEAISDNENWYGTPQPEETEDFEAFAHFIREHEKNLHYSDSVLRAVWMHVQSKNSRLAILAGPPGSGKTSLVELVAEFFNRDTGNDWEHYHLLQPVSPTWFSPSSLLGSYSEIDGQYHSTEFLRFLMTAEEHREWIGSDGRARLFFACLDEFNIAQPEQYMASLLSKIEAKPGSKARSLTLCRKDKMGWSKDLTIQIAPNLRLFATINTDVSSKTLSPKVLDRSVFIRLTPDFEDLKHVANQLAGRYNVKDFHEALFREKGQSRDTGDPEPTSVFGDLVMIGRHGQSPFGYRVLEQAYEHAFHHPRRERDLDEVIDEVICNFFLPKLPGSHAVANPIKYANALDKENASWVHTYKRSSEILELIEGGLPGQAAV